MAISDPSVYTDFSALSSLKAKAAKDKAGALDEVAGQFEALFLHMMLKEMRKASLAEGIFDSNQTKFYRDIYDQQLSLHLSKQGGLGLTDVLKRQLGGVPESAEPFNRPEHGYPLMPAAGLGGGIDAVMQTGTPSVRNTVVTASQNSASKAVDVRADNTPFKNREDFVSRLWPHAQEAAAKLGVEPDALIAQAALETGWGKHQMKGGDGSSAHNLFGIKADRRWQGDRVGHSTLEYENGVAVRKREPFRAYNGYRQSFLDYADFISSNPRYDKALRASGDSRAYFRELQAAGYATDPNYAKKLASILESEEMRTAKSRL